MEVTRGEGGNGGKEKKEKEREERKWVIVRRVGSSV